MEFELCLNSEKLGGLLSSFKDAIEPGYRQGAIYKINCSDCYQCYIGETKSWFEMRKKEDMKNSDNNTTALSLSTQLNLTIQSIGKTTKFCKLKLTTINANSFNCFLYICFLMFLMIKNLFLFYLYTKICFRNIIISIF